MKRMVFLLAMMIYGLSATADAALISRGTDSLGNRLIYDNDLNITWYDFSEEGTWLDAKNWAANLDVNFGGTHYNDWRLPSALNPDGSGPTEGFNVTGSEMGHLYYTELGKVAKGSLGSTGPFENLLEFTYWFNEKDGATRAWNFEFGHSGSYAGSQDNSYDSWIFSALAVRDGDVTLPAPLPENWLGDVETVRESVPEPGTWMLLGSGLVGLAAFRRRRALK